MKQELILTQSLQWKINQSLLQSIHILQLTSGDLIDYLKDVAEENPLIEEIDVDMQWEQFKPTSPNFQSIGEMNQTEITMSEQLKAQMYTLSVSGELKSVIEFGIDSLNEDGYLDIELEEWAIICKTTIETVEYALAKIQTLEPFGIGARNLPECILLQLKQMNYDEPFIGNLLMENLEIVADNNPDLISEIYKVTSKEAIQLIESIKLCHPKPGQLLASARTEYIIPEASIYREDGEWKLTFFKWANPKVVLNQEYEKLNDPGNEAADYLKKKYKEIDTLRQAIQYRGSTLEGVIRFIMKKQLPFFERGSYMIQPLTLRDIANELGLHTSTISRAISQKYIQTNQGVLPLKFFLQSGIQKEGGGGTAAYVIKQLLLDIIKEEDKRKPLSDEAIRKKLKHKFNIDVARRTVMKYRDQLKIGSSIKRKSGE